MIDIFIDKLPIETIREHYRDGRYGKLDAKHIRGWLALRGG